MMLVSQSGLGVCPDMNSPDLFSWSNLLNSYPEITLHIWEGVSAPVKSPQCVCWNSRVHVHRVLPRVPDFVLAAGCFGEVTLLVQDTTLSL